MNVVFMGTPEFASTILTNLVKYYNVVLVVSQPDRAKSKGKILETPVKVTAKNLGIDVFQPDNIKKDYQKIIDTDADILITAAYGQYIPSFILNKFKYKLNVHGSILPKHRGGAPIQRAIMEGDKRTGITIMEMTKKLDAGRIYGIKELDILDEDNSTSIFDKLAIIGSNYLIELLPNIINGNNVGYPQDESLATFSPNIQKEEEIISFNNKAIDIINQIRGLAYNPGAHFMFNNINVKVFKAHIVIDNSNNIPGYVLKIKKGVLIKAKDNAIMLDEVLLPGKKIVDGVSFSNGQKLFSVGDIIE